MAHSAGVTSCGERGGVVLASSLAETESLFYLSDVGIGRLLFRDARFRYLWKSNIPYPETELLEPIPKPHNLAWKLL